jgi:two-component sensor histidine kinase
LHILKLFAFIDEEIGLNLDLRTMVFLDGVLLLMAAILMLGFALVIRPRRRELNLWSIAYSTLFVGVVLFALRGFISDFLSIVVGNTLILAFYPLLNCGIDIFRGRKVLWKLAIVVVAAVAAWFYWFSIVEPSLPARFFMYSAFTIGACAGGGFAAAWRPNPRLVAVSRITAAIYGCIGLINIARIYFGLRGLPANIMDGETWDGVIQTLSGILVAILCFALLLLNAQLRNQELAQALIDRDLLLRETAHRTKNDLALVDSLISLEQGAFESACDLESGAVRLESLKGKIRCMALAHDLLSHSEKPGTVRLDEYLESVAAGLPTRPGIELERDFAEVVAPFAFAAPLGLAMNELATNSLKYAYPQGKGGTISLSLRMKGAEGEGRAAILEVRDRGVGTAWPPKKPGLGSAIVEALAAKLNGAVSYAFDGGSVFSLCFDLPAYLPSAPSRPPKLGSSSTKARLQEKP